MPADQPSIRCRAVLRVVDLRKDFHSRHHGVIALDGISLHVAEGQFTTVLGPSGSGKTTLLRCIAGFETPDSGVIELAGRTLDAPGVASVRPYSRGIGIVPQEGALFPHLSVAENIGFGLTGTTRSRRREQVAGLLQLVGMDGLGDRRPHELSGGQQQRVALARALAPQPKLILLDEPFSALDAKLRVELRDEIVGLLRSVGATAILVTHDQTEALTLADQLVVMRAGRIVAAGEPHGIYDRPPDIETGRFLGSATVLPGTVVRDGAGVHVDGPLGSMPIASWHGQEGRCLVLLRPEQLTALAGGGATGNGAAGVVVDTSYSGADTQLHVTLLDSQLDVTVRTPGHHRYARGDVVHVSTTAAVCTYATDDADHGGVAPASRQLVDEEPDREPDEQRTERSASLGCRHPLGDEGTEQ